MTSVLDRLRGARWDAQEASGALGDLGTFLPLVVGISQATGLDFGVTLFFAGLLNVATGLMFSVPMAVQPMKAIAAVAITQGLTGPQVAAAGLLVSGLVLVVGVLGLAERLTRLIPDEVVRGLQLALGLSLAVKGGELVLASGLDRWVLALPAAALAWRLRDSRRLPVALLVFATGLAVTLFRNPEAASKLTLGLHLPALLPFSAADFKQALFAAAIPQLPLTLLNSVVAVCALSRDLFPQHPLSERKVAVSVGLMNLVSGWFGAVPMCHGAGGLAGQVKFGARTNGAILMLGAGKLVLAIAFGSSLMALCIAFPKALLGVMLAFSGLALAEAARSAKDLPLTLLTAAGCLGLGPVAGVAAGFVAHRLKGLRFRRDEAGDSPPPGL
ncbi:MAG: putative sulfate/molybdate transporter [Holophagaceae bacterium]|nr:putative sulfate/molybdate transporter [Holophagaceae bacterium]